ncbi:MAG: hypothetical protein FWE18_03765 [Alphaproteobacteria bacterium]|nr:hypothetical protein [Alphaproteobacteria bacterium]
MKNLTIKEIVSQASNMLGVGVIEDNDSLFNNVDEGSINWLAFCNMCFDEIFKDIFNKNVLLDVSISLLTPAKAVKNSAGYYSYEIGNLPIVKILSVRDGNNKLNRVVSYEELNRFRNKRYSYIQKHSSIATAELFKNLTIEYLDSRIFLNAAGELVESLIADTDIIIVDNSLVIYKLCALVADSKAMPQAASFKQQYAERLAYIIQDNLINRKPLYL